MGMVVFSHYPADPRPRRAVDAVLRQGMELDLVCLADGQNPKRETLGGLKVFRIPIERRRGGKLGYVYQYSAFILASAAILGMRSLTRRYDFAYVHNMPDVLVASALVPKALGAKVILDLHDPMPELMMTIFGLEKDSHSVRLIERLEKWSLARAHLVITVNAACKAIFGSRSCSPEKITVVMNAPDDNIFRLCPVGNSSPADTRASKRFVIMYHGSLVERNGLDLAVDAMAKVREVMPTAELRVFGASTPFLEQVMNTVRTKHLEDVVRYLGPRRLEDLVTEIEQCDVGIIPNHRNAFTEINTPTRIFEYLAVGRAVIAPRTKGILEYFDRNALFFFEAGNSAELAERILHVGSHPEEVRETVRRGQEIFQAHTWPQEKHALLTGLCELLERNNCH